MTASVIVGSWIAGSSGCPNAADFLEGTCRVRGRARFIATAEGRVAAQQVHPPDLALRQLFGLEHRHQLRLGQRRVAETCSVSGPREQRDLVDVLVLVLGAALLDALEVPRRAVRLAQPAVHVHRIGEELDPGWVAKPVAGMPLGVAEPRLDRNGITAPRPDRRLHPAVIAEQVLVAQPTADVGHLAQDRVGLVQLA